MVRRAFTLVELLVVVAVMAILLALLGAALSGVRDRMRAVQCASNLRQLHTGAESHLADTGSYPFTENAYLSGIAFCPSEPDPPLKYVYHVNFVYTGFFAESQAIRSSSQATSRHALRHATREIADNNGMVYLDYIPRDEWERGHDLAVYAHGAVGAPMRPDGR